MIRNLLRRNSTYLVLLLLITVAVFWDLPKTFYQQDEWQTLGYNLSESSRFLFQTKNPLQLFFNELRPLSQAMYVILLGYFKFTVVPAVLLAIFLHFLSSGLLFYLVNYLTKSKSIAFLSAVFLVVNSVSHQAVTWVSAVSTLPAVVLILTSLIFYFWYLDKKGRKFLYLSVLSAILSLYFKGVGLFLFVLLPVLPFIYKGLPFNKKNIVNVLKDNAAIIAFGALMVGVRFGAFFFRTEKIVGYAGGGQGEGFIFPVLVRTILYPLTSLFQIFVPPIDLYSFTQVLTRMQYKFLVGSPLIDLVAQSVVADMVSIVGSLLILFAIFLIVLIKRDVFTKKNLLFAASFFFLCFLPYVALDRDSSYLSSRYFYAGLIPAGIIFGYVVFFLSGFGKYTKFIVFFLAAVYLFHHATIVRRDIGYQVKLAEQRLAVLNGIRSLHPTPSGDSVFYVTGDKEYYGSITNPFQNGLGYVLEVWYYDTGRIPKEFLSENFLWDLGSEGYGRSGDSGFGYYQDMDKMIEDAAENKFKADIVHGFFINSSDMKIVDITQDVRTKISTVSATSDD